MTKIVVVSDSHGDNQILKDVASKHNDADVFLHLGDSETYESEIYPFITIKGNNDYLINDEVKVLAIAGDRFYLTHGHRNYLDDNNMVRIAKKNECDFFLFGHTHRPYYKVIDNIYLINPGSLSYPRSSYGRTYGIIIIGDDKSIDYKLIEIDK